MEAPKAVERSDWQSSLNIRSFDASDTEEVKRICFAHFRSLAPSAVMYFCSEHAQDLFVLLGSAKLFVSWGELFILSAIFIAYLFIRARWEMECYIKRHCPDLTDIVGAYLSDPMGGFWVAENMENVKDGKAELVGCIGFLPYRGDQNVGQLMRLVVSVSSRRMRVGSRLLAQLEQFAMSKDYNEIRLFTNNLNTTHMKFVRLHGFETLQVVRRGLMRGDLIQWRKELVRKEDPLAVRTRKPTLKYMD